MNFLKNIISRGPKTTALATGASGQLAAVMGEDEYLLHYLLGFDTRATSKTGTIEIEQSLDIHDPQYRSNLNKLHRMISEATGHSVSIKPSKRFEGSHDFIVKGVTLADLERVSSAISGLFKRADHVPLSFTPYQRSLFQYVDNTNIGAESTSYYHPVGMEYGMDPDVMAFTLPVKPGIRAEGPFAENSLHTALYMAMRKAKFPSLSSDMEYDNVKGGNLVLRVPEKSVADMGLKLEDGKARVTSALGGIKQANKALPG